MVDIDRGFSVDSWLPTTVKEMKSRGWDSVDVVLFSGDAYVDHPSFPAAVVGRIMEREGLRVAIVPQPNWQDDLRDFKKFGKPNMFFAVSAGAMDSMVNHYTANKRRRSDDAYTPDNRAGARPDYATDTYCSIIKKLYPDVPVIIGGIEASLRRVTHYDYWSDRLKPSILSSSGADLLFYGMGEKSLPQFIRLVKRGVPVNSITNVAQTAFIVEHGESFATNKRWESVELKSHKECLGSKKSFASNFKIVEVESNSLKAKRITQRIGKQCVVINPPFDVMKEKEIDASFDMPFTRLPHPKYKSRKIAAYDMIKHSINTHRGCFGGCSFCTISAHQGKFIVSRSRKSILKEARAIVEMPDFNGTITDVGGPSANMYKLSGKDKSICEKCKRPSCIFPGVCKNLDNNHSGMTQLYRDVNAVPGIKNLFIGSGIRYDMVLNRDSDNSVNSANEEYLREVIKSHVSGRLKVAPEHTSDKVLRSMRKPSFSLYYDLKVRFDKLIGEFGINRELIPYFISSHPDCEVKDMADLAIQTKRLGYRLEQVQDFTPTPMTLSTVIYYSGVDPYTGRAVSTAKKKRDKLDQRALFFWYKREMQSEIKQILSRANLKSIITQLLSK